MRFVQFAVANLRRLLGSGTISKVDHDNKTIQARRLCRRSGDHKCRGCGVKGQIPDDRWHEPYMGEEELRSELEAGVRFSIHVDVSRPVGVMGIQDVKNVCLIRHAYVLPDWQGKGVGAKLIAEVCNDLSRPILIGTWRAATWAIRFYERHGFHVMPEAAFPTVLKTYWQVPERQIETSVVLADRPLSMSDVNALIADAGD